MYTITIMEFWSSLAQPQWNEPEWVLCAGTSSHRTVHFLRTKIIKYTHTHFPWEIHLIILLLYIFYRAYTRRVPSCHRAYTQAQSTSTQSTCEWARHKLATHTMYVVRVHSIIIIVFSQCRTQSAIEMKRKKRNRSRKKNNAIFSLCRCKRLREWR